MELKHAKTFYYYYHHHSSYHFKVFQGNYDDQQYVSNRLLNPIQAKYLKIVPTEVNSGVSTIAGIRGYPGADTNDTVLPLTEGK